MSILSTPELHQRWRDRWTDFLEDVESETTVTGVQNALRDKVIIGNAERKIAGGHEGREILELLQNARDAIWNSDSTRGRVHVGVYDEGVLVANTGSRFDLFDEQVENAVTMIGETGKGDTDGQSIGHKGVGLKSILATGDSFEIFTRPEETSDEILGVRLSRSYLLSSLLRRLGHNTPQADITGDLADPELESLLMDTPDREPVEVAGIQNSISKLPLFNFPVPLSMKGELDDPIRRRVQELLTENPEKNRDQFRTAVFIRYEDTDWRTQLADLGVNAPEEDERSVKDRPERIWNYLAAGASDGGLKPETLVQLGGIEELQLERSTSAHGNAVKREQWDLTRTQSSNLTTPELSHNDIKVHIQSEEEETTYGYDQFRFANSRDHHVALLVNKTAGNNEPPVTSYPLYLFYPIEGTDSAQLPFCLHGRFQVETNRKDLSSNNAETNQEVLEEGLDLLELVGEEVAAATHSVDAPTYSDQLPWVLLPPVPENAPSGEPAADELISWFQQELLNRLATTTCIPTPNGSEQPGATLLHWNETVINGYLGYSAVQKATARTADGSAGSPRPLPAESALTALLTMSADWSHRIKALLNVVDEGPVSKEILTDWVTGLSNSLSMGPDDTPALLVPADPARSLLEGTVSLLMAATEPKGSISDVLQETASELNGIYLLPCRVRGTDPNEELALVTLEQRQAPGGGQPQARRVRSVIWNIESETRDVERPPTPPQSANMTVYFLDDRIQNVSDVHHVLSAAGRVWGLREYEGIPSFVRSLLDTFADGRSDVVKPIDFAFLSAIINRLGAESTDLQTGEGEFFPLDYLQTAVTQQEGDQRGNLRRRVQLRNCDVQLHKDSRRHIPATILDDAWQVIREREKSSDADESDDPTVDWQDIQASDQPGPTWPAPESETWDVFQDQIHREVTQHDFVRTLGLLGAGSLPGIQVTWMYGDDHPSMRQSRHWNPTEWTRTDFPDTVPDTIQSLQNALAQTPAYLAAVTSPDHHPQRSADHSRKCDVKLTGDLDQVNLASWVWIDDVDQLTDHAAAVRETLRRHGSALNSTLLRTGWSCNNGHKRRSWEQSVPSLLNWQLRQLSVWGPIVSVQDELETAWSEYAEQLRYAVKMDSRRGAQAARMFPYIEENSRFDDDVLASLGVRSISNLGMTGATDRLQQLQAILVDGNLPTEGTRQLWIPGERINDWNQAYTQLLQPALQRLPEDTDAGEPDLNWGSLTHLPLRDGDHWVTASVEWINANSDQIRYYPDQSPKPWETQEVQEKGFYILPRTAGGPFTRLASALDVQQLQASKLVFDLDADDINLVTDRYNDTVAAFQQALTERRDLLVASTERADEDEVTATANELSTAIANLAIAESFPEKSLRQLSDPTSALYATSDGDEALIVNAAKSGDSPTLDSLAMGLALLFERPTKVATFREALRTDIEVPELELRWAKRTFPIETVRRILGSNALQAIERDLAALTDLLERFDVEPIVTDPLITALEDADTEQVMAVRHWLATGTRGDKLSPEDGQLDIESIDTTVQRLRNDLPEHAAFVATALFSETATYWVREFEELGLDTETERTIIEWLDDNRAALDRPPFDNAARQAFSRFLTVTELWDQTDTSELSELETWVDRLEELHTSTLPSWTVSIQTEYASILDCPPLVVHVCLNDRVDTLVEAFCDDIAEELPTVEFDWRELITTYVEDETLPDPEPDVGAKDHQQRAFDDIATSMDGEDIAFSPEGPSTVQATTSLSVSTGGSSGGGSSQFRGRGQQAEAYVMAGVLDRVAEWLTNETGSSLMKLRSGFRQLHDNQEVADYKWHVPSAWSSDLHALLERIGPRHQAEIEHWREQVAEGTPFNELPLIQLINVTMERGPGFDVIDPLGPISTDQGKDDFGLWFTPVEIKAINGTTPPFSFRLTVNEYRQAKAFIREGIPYVIRLVSVPEVGTLNWPAHTSVVTENVIKTVEELDVVVDSERFEEVVKGGYMNMQVE